MSGFLQKHVKKTKTSESITFYIETFSNRDNLTQNATLIKQYFCKMIVLFSYNVSLIRNNCTYRRSVHVCNAKWNKKYKGKHYFLTTNITYDTYLVLSNISYVAWCLALPVTTDENLYSLVYANDIKVWRDLSW